jgi:transcriptional regulator with XRE-family HTH domain
LGDYLREQRKVAQLSIRQLAAAAGVSNPYLSQIERGIRKPSAGVLQQIAKALRISAEQLYVQAGLLEPSDDSAPLPGGGMEVAMAVLADPTLTERQKRVLLDIHASFRSQNAGHNAGDDEPRTE